MELYDPSGTLVAGDDNSAPDGRNALLTHQATSTGSYVLRVLSYEQRLGEYSVEITGNTAPLPPFEVTAAGPLAWKVQAEAELVEMTIELNDSLRLNSLDASDLVVDGVPAVAVTVVDRDTVAFQLPAGLSEGAYEIVIASGAMVDLQGTPIERMAATFRVFEGPIIVSTAADEDDGYYAPGDLSLREALALADEFPGEDVIQFDNSLSGSTILLAALGKLDTNSDVEIQGLGPGQLTIDGGGETYLFEVRAGVTASISGVSITGGWNPGEKGGAIRNAGDLTITDAHLFGNSTGLLGAGGAIYTYGNQASLTIHNATLSDNLTPRGGGAIRIEGGSATLTNVTISDNSGPLGGGGIHSSGNAVLTVDNATIVGNFGNGIEIIGGEATVTNSTISGNTGKGGGIRSTLATLTLANTIISGNSAIHNGGGIYITAGEVTITDCTISGNSADEAYSDGGGIYYVGMSGELTISQSTISGNSADDQGGGIYSIAGSMRLTNVTVSGNSASSYGSGIYNGFATVTTLTNVTAVYNSVHAKAPVTLHNSIVYDFRGNLDPRSSHNLIDAGPPVLSLADNGGPTRTHALLADSPAIDAGSNELAIAAGLTVDQRGFLRAVDGDGDGTDTVDIGAFEFESTLPAKVVGRYVFYNNSRWDQTIATDKEALLPGQTASLANYTSYARGLGGIMIDITGVPGTITADDFTFRIGNDNDPANWQPAPVPTVDVQPGATTRVTMTWPDNTIQNQWLQVTVKADPATTGLVADDVFYYGNLIGEATGDGKVDAVDVLDTRNNPRPFFAAAEIDTVHDFNRDKRVNAIDTLIARNHQTWSGNELVLIDLSQARAAKAVDGAQRVGLRASTHPTNSGKLDWLFEFEPSNARSQQPGRVERAVDKLLPVLGE